MTPEQLYFPRNVVYGDSTNITANLYYSSMATDLNQTSFYSLYGITKVEVWIRQNASFPWVFYGLPQTAPNLPNVEYRFKIINGSSFVWSRVYQTSTKNTRM